MIEKMTCAMCKKPKKNLSLEPTRRQLLFGGFPHKYEYRCQSCENKVDKWIQRLLAGIEKIEETPYD